MIEKKLQVIGAREVENHIVELTLIPYTSKEVRQKHKGFIEMAMSGMVTKDIIKEVQGHRQQISKLYITRDEWLNIFKNKIYSAIDVNINMFKEMPDRS